MNIIDDLKRKHEKCLRDIETTEQKKEEYIKSCDEIIENCKQQAEELERAIKWLELMPKGVSEDESGGENLACS